VGEAEICGHDTVNVFVLSVILSLYDVRFSQ
jgi:hypothetical protein